MDMCEIVGWNGIVVCRRKIFKITHTHSHIKETMKITYQIMTLDLMLTFFIRSAFKDSSHVARSIQVSLAPKENKPKPFATPEDV